MEKGGNDANQITQRKIAIGHDSFDLVELKQLDKKATAARVT
jgi:hypothetical protein